MKADKIILFREQIIRALFIVSTLFSLYVLVPSDGYIIYQVDQHYTVTEELMTVGEYREKKRIHHNGTINNFLLFKIVRSNTGDICAIAFFETVLFL